MRPSLSLMSYALQTFRRGAIHVQASRRCFAATSQFSIDSNFKSLGPVVGMYAQVEHAFDQASVNTFAGLCGDNNPLHIDPAFAATTMFKGPIVHGILVSSLFSTLFGRTVHGSIYVSQNLKFKRPVMVGSAVIARMEVVECKSTSKGAMLSCKTTVYLKDGDKAVSELKAAVEGDAVVLVPPKA